MKEDGWSIKTSRLRVLMLLISYWIGPWLAIVCVDFFCGCQARDGSKCVRERRESRTWYPQEPRVVKRG